MKIFFIRWLVCWCTLLQGIAGVLSLGFFKPSWELRSAKWLSRTRYQNEK